MQRSTVDVARAEKKAAEESTSSKRPYGADALEAAIGACTKEAQVVLVILEPDAEGTMDYIVEYAGEAARKGVPWWHVLGLLNAGIAKTSFDMFAPLDGDPYDGTGYNPGDEADDETDEEMTAMDNKMLDDEPGE
jgi:hypothetical protein